MFTKRLLLILEQSFVGTYSGLSGLGLLIFFIVDTYENLFTPSLKCHGNNSPGGDVHFHYFPSQQSSQMFVEWWEFITDFFAS